MKIEVDKREAFNPIDIHITIENEADLLRIKRLSACAAGIAGMLYPVGSTDAGHIFGMLQQLDVKLSTRGLG